MKKYSLLLILTLLILVSCARKKDTVIVSVDGQNLDREVFTRRYRLSIDFRKNSHFTREMVVDFIDKNFIDDLLLQAEAYASGIDKEPDLAQQLDKQKKRLLIKPNGPLYRYILRGKVTASDDDVKKLYDSIDHKIKIAQIVVSSKKLADSLYTALKNGADFDKLVARYSIDFYSRDKGGVIEQYLLPGTMPPQFEAVAFKMQKGDISEPVKTAYGYHIIKLIDRQEVNKPPFEELKDLLTQRVKDRKINEYSQQFVRQLYENYHVSIDSKKVGLIIDAFRKSKVKPRRPEMDIKVVPEDRLDVPVVTYDSGQWTVRDFIQQYNNAPAINRIPLERAEDVSNFVFKQIANELKYLEALKLGLDKDKNFQKEYNHTKDLTVMTWYRQKILYDNTPVPEKELKAFYQAHKEKWGNQTFDEVKSRVLYEYRSQKSKERFNSIIKNLRNKYSVKYHDAVIKSVVKELNKMKKEQKSAD